MKQTQNVFAEVVEQGEGCSERANTTQEQTSTDTHTDRESETNDMNLRTRG